MHDGQLYKSFFKNCSWCLQILAVRLGTFWQLLMERTITTVNGKVISNGVAIYFEDIALCNQEEADTKVILHLFYGCRKGYKKLTIAVSGTDTVMLLFITFMILIDWILHWSAQKVATCTWICNLLMGRNMRSFIVLVMQSQVVTQGVRSVIEVKRHHEMFGVPLKKTKELFQSKSFSFF